MESKDSKLAQVTATIAQLGSMDVSDPSSQVDIIRQCQLVINSLKDPRVQALETLSSVVTLPCLASLSNLGIFKKLSDEPVTAAQLAEQCGVDRWLVVRLMRVATAWDLVTEIGLETYTATEVSNVFASPPGAAGLRVNQMIHKLLDSLPAYLKETEYRNPGNTPKGLFQYAYQTELGSFAYLGQDPEYAKQFNTFMTIQRTQGQEQWTEKFDLASRVFDGVTIDQNVPLLVDVAGGVGKDLSLVKKSLPPSSTASGQLVLEDQGHVIDRVPTELQDSDFKYVKHDFFTPQPVKGARVYMLKHILHNWSNSKALQILRHTRDAMTPGYSKIWILDGIVPDTGADKTVAALDIGMMGIHGALERNEEQWDALLAEAGLKFTGLCVLEDDGFGIIEAVVEV
ncbi:O-methyltransferase-domain-containing protein [Aspergillus cavernicola]|uniref:O-methyltransferase-domain-containing protein n=1 Tax=Aspergillus cavernicola TaxID=176166 RepID=A0ABR4IFX9_9EURO